MGAFVLNPGRAMKYHERPYNSRYVLWMCLLFAVLVTLRAVNNVFFYVFAAVSVVAFAASSTSHCLAFLFFLLPSATILKIDTEAMSFFAILFFVTIVRMVIVQRKIAQNLVVLLIIFCIYNLIMTGTEQITALITMAAGLLMLYCIRYKNLDVSQIVTVYALGICLASILGLLHEELPIVNTFVKDAMLKLGQDNYAARFSGLHGNPNYYSMDISVLLAAMIVLMYNHKTKLIHMILLFVLALFGAMTVSKSFLVATVVLLVCWLGLSAKEGARGIVRNVVLTMVGALVLYLFSADAINTYIERLLQDQSASLDDITTGRLEIWKAYLEAIFGDFKILMFGNGLNTILESLRARTHNTFIEALFAFGLFGSVLFFSTLRNAMGRISGKSGRWIVIVIILVRMFAIGVLTYDNLWFYLAILVMFSSGQGTTNTHKIPGYAR